MCDVFRVRLERGLATTRKNKQLKPGTPAQSGRANPYILSMEKGHAAQSAEDDCIMTNTLRVIIRLIAVAVRRWWSK